MGSFACSKVLSEAIFSWVLRANICLRMFTQVFNLKRKQKCWRRNVANQSDDKPRHFLLTAHVIISVSAAYVYSEQNGRSCRCPLSHGGKVGPEFLGPSYSHRVAVRLLHLRQTNAGRFMACDAVGTCLDQHKYSLGLSLSGGKMERLTACFSLGRLEVFGSIQDMKSQIFALFKTQSLLMQCCCGVTGDWHFLSE